MCYIYIIFISTVFFAQFTNGEVNMVISKQNITTAQVSCIVTGDDLYSGVLLNYKLNGDVTYTKQDWNRNYLLKCVNVVDCFEEINSEWTIGNTRYGINDLRFEDLTTISTQNSFILADIKVEKVRQYFSVLAKHITVAVCEKEEFGPDNKCYLFVFDEDNLTLLDCVLTSPEATLDDCKSLASVQTKTISDKEWWSFYIYYAGGEIRVNNARDNQRLLGYKISWRAQNVFIKSKNNALWKFYINDFIHTHDPDEILKVKNFDLDSNKLCVSMEISLGSDCYFEVMAERDGALYKQIVQTPNEIKERKNIPVEFTFPETSKGPVKLSVKTVGDGDFWWAIYSIHTCPEDPRIITSVIVLPENNKETIKKELFCQELKSEKFIRESTPEGTADCIPDHFGMNCNLSCSEILGPNYINCPRVKICSENDCKCAKGFWGEQCLQGTFIGVLENLLKTSNIGPDFITLEVNQNGDYENIKLSASFTIQYMETFSNANTKQKEVFEWPPTSQTYDLKNLKPGVSYSIRAVFFDTDDVEFFNVTTKCEGAQCDGETLVSRFAENGCMLPEHPRNGFHEYSSGAQSYPGTITAIGTHIIFKCNPGYRIYGHDISLCKSQSEWSVQVPKCLASCETLKSESLDITCSLNGSPRRCEDEMVHGTIATYKCKQFYEIQQSTNSPAVKCFNGRWSDPLPKCEIRCGRRNSQGIPLIISPNNDATALKHEYPWHVAIYDVASTPLYICGGSIINYKLIVTAAHCFSDVNSPEKYEIVAGKVFSKYDHPYDKYAQKRKVENVSITAHYRGDSNHYIQDIAIVVVKTPFEFNTFVTPVCVDWQQLLPSMEPYEVGHVVGWGYTSEIGNVGEKLNHIDVPYVPHSDCINNVKNDFKVYVTPDKFCAGYLNGTSVCQGDSGGGFTRVIKSLYGQTKHYLTGIVSIAPYKGTSCDSYQYAAYTDVKRHIDFVKDVELYTRTTSNRK